MEERHTREEYDPFNQTGRRGIHEAGMEPNNADNLRVNNADNISANVEENMDYEDYEPRIRQPRQHMQGVHINQGAGYQPIEELTKRMKIDVPDFYGKLEPRAFEDWLTTIKDYFDWFAVLEERKVRYVQMKL